MDLLEDLIDPDDNESLASIRQYLQHHSRRAGLELDLRILLTLGSRDATRTALETARQFDDPVDRALALLKCAEKADPYYSAAAFKEALEAVSDVDDNQIRDVIHDAWRRALGRHRSTVFGTPEDIFCVANAGSIGYPEHSMSKKFRINSARARGSFLGRADSNVLRSHIPDSLIVAKGLETEWGRANAVAGISPYLLSSTTDDAIRIADGLKAPAPRARAYASIALTVAGQDRQEGQRLFLEAFNCVNEIGTRQQKLSELRHLSARATDADIAREVTAEIKSVELALRADRIAASGPTLGRGLDVRSNLPVLTLEPKRFDKSKTTIAARAASAYASDAAASTRDELDRFIDSIDVNEIDSELADGAISGTSEGNDPVDVTTNIAIADPRDPEIPLSHSDSIMVDRSYLLLVDLGAQRNGWLAVGPPPSDEMVPKGENLDVVLYSNDPQTKLVGPTSGVLRAANRQFMVKKVAARPAGTRPHALTETLFFKFLVLGDPHRDSHLRLSFFYDGVLIQSRSITLAVGSNRAEPPIQATLDYQLAKNLRPRTLQSFRHHDLCLMMNDVDDGSHGFHFFSREGGQIASTAIVDSHSVQSTISHIRRELRAISWGSEEEWDPNQHKYRYDRPPRAATFLRDIRKLAIAGKGHLDQITQQLTGTEQSELLKRMLAPGHIQLALKNASRAVLPISLFYDLPLDLGRPEGSFKLCGEFLKDSARIGDRFKSSKCFKGKCPNHEDDSIICPSGFWGFRHEIGLPLSLPRLGENHPNTAGHVCTDVDGCRYLAAYYTGDEFQLRDSHIASLRRRYGTSIVEADSRLEAIDVMTNERLSLVYFYCHGGLIQDRFPYLHIGSADDHKFLRSTISESSIRWVDSRPVVFINGCHTTQVQPENAVEIVSGFLEAGASAVTGTEITIFESLAVEFANVFMGMFLKKGKSFGASIRDARLALLESLNPLGLVYIPFGLGTLTLKPTKAPVGEIEP